MQPVGPAQRVAHHALLAEADALVDRSGRAFAGSTSSHTRCVPSEPKQWSSSGNAREPIPARRRRNQPPQLDAHSRVQSSEHRVPSRLTAIDDHQKRQRVVGQSSAVLVLAPRRDPQPQPR